MRLAYDKDTHALFIHFGSGAYVESEEVSPGVVIDFDRAGKPIALELEDVRGIVDEKALLKLTQPRIKTGADLRDFRDRLGLTQEVLASLLDIPKNTIARWERGELSIEKLRLLELALAAVAAGGSVQGKSAPRRPTPRFSDVKETVTVPARKTTHVTEMVSVHKPKKGGRQRRHSGRKT